MLEEFYELNSEDKFTVKQFLCKFNFRIRGAPLFEPLLVPKKYLVFLNMYSDRSKDDHRDDLWTLYKAYVSKTASLRGQRG